MRRIRLSAVLALFVFLLMGPNAWSSEGGEDNWQVGLSVYHSSGDYGTRSTTKITSVPLTDRKSTRLNSSHRH